jgi:acyl carrier protein
MLCHDAGTSMQVDKQMMRPAPPPFQPLDDPRATRILEIVAKETSIECAALRPEATIEDLGISSLDLIQAVFAIETSFDIEIPVVANRAGAEFTTISELVAHVLAVLDKDGESAPAATLAPDQPA